MTPPPTTHESLRIPVDGVSVDAVSALLGRAEGKEGNAPAVLLAHGAGAPMDSEFMEAMASGLVQAGHDVLRFSYPYTERARRESRRFPPDRMPKLEIAHRAALAHLREWCPGKSIVMAGKSMGGRVASHLAASGEECAGLVYLGYPLHPQGKPEKLRNEHFPDVSPPSLFLQGTRDGLCDLDLLSTALTDYAGPWKLVTVEDGDHSFKVPKRSGLSIEDVQQRLVREIASWIEEL